MSSIIRLVTNPFTRQQVEAPIFPKLTPGDATSVALHVGTDTASLRGCRFGGPALLPKQEKWPEGPNGPLSFVGQLDFEALANVSRRLSFPDHGVVSFFYDVERQPWGFEVDDKESWRLVYVGEPDSATCASP